MRITEESARQARERVSGTMHRRTERTILIVYLLGFILISATIAIFQPSANTSAALASPPDESARFLVPWYICQHGSIPTGFEEEVRIPGYRGR